MAVSPGKIIGTFIVVAATAAGVFLAVRAGAMRRGDELGEEFQLDLTPYRQVDPNLIAWHELPAIAVRMTQCRGVAADRQDRIYVVGDEMLHVVDANGTVLGGHRMDGPPRCVSVAPDGSIFVGMKDRFESLRPLDTWSRAHEDPRRCGSFGPKAVITSIAATAREVFVADYGNRVVVRCTRDGNEIRRIGLKDSERNIEGFVIPSPHFDVAMGTDTLLRVTNPGRRRVEAYTLDGDMEGAWGRSGMGIADFCGCCNPTDLAVLGDGRIVTSEKGLPRVKLYDAQGRFLCVVAPPAAFSPDDEGMDLAADSKGRIIVLDPAARTIRIFEENK